MSSDRFISGVQLPHVDVGVVVRASDGASYRRTYYKQGNLYFTDEAGTETQLTGLSVTFSDLDANSVIVSTDAFADVDNQLMSAAAINDLIDTRIAGLGSGGLSNVVEDTTPQLGGDLDLNSSDITGTGNITLTGDVSVTGDINATSTINMISPDTTNTITIDMFDSDTISFSGDSGELFSVTDSLTGTIFSVNDISGTPSIEVDDDGTVRFAEIDGNVLIGTSLDNGTDKVQITGSLSVSSININAESISDSDIVNWNAAFSWGDHSTAGYLTSETVTSLSLATNILSYTDENNNTTDLDLSLYLDDTNLARLVSGSLDGGTGIATFTRDDATTFTVDFSPFFDDTNLARITSASFGTGDGVLTLTRDDATTVTVDLDGRYLEDAPSDGSQYARQDGAWSVVAPAGLENVVEDTTPQLGGNLDINGNDITGTGNINITGTATIASTIDMVSPDTTNTISIDMLDSDTITFTGDSGELFSIADSLTGTIFSVADISGIPLVEVDADTTIKFAQVNGTVLIGTTVDNTTDKLQVNGSISATGGTSTDWNTAFGWGNHASAGYLTDAPSDGSQYARQDGAWSVVAATGGGLENVVEDTTPQLGGNLDLNSNDITGTGNITITGEVNATQVQLSGGTGDQGTLTWNTDEETLDLNEGVHTLRLGQEVLYHVRNNSGSSIAIGTPVMATGTLGASGRITIAPMDGTNPANAKFYLGVATETIANDADGKVTHFGKVRGIDTSIYDEGDVLWISTDTVGAFTTTEPTIGIKIPTAFTLNSTNNGTIVVRAKNSIGLLDLDDVEKVTLTATEDGYILAWDNSNSKFAFSAPPASYLPTKIDPITVVNGQATYALTVSSAAYTPASVNTLMVSLNGVTQSPGDAFTISGSNITFIPALETNDVIDYIIDIGAAVETLTTTETDTLDTVTNRGSSTANTVTVGELSTGLFTSTGKIVEQTYTLTGTTPALDPANGTIQYWVLTGNSTPTDGLSNGEFLTLQIDDGASYTITWPTMNWVGGSAPILFGFENNIIHLWKINNILYGSFIGAA